MAYRGASYSMTTVPRTEANKAQRWSGSFGALIGVVGSAVTVVLTILNFQLNSRLQLTEARLKEQAQQFDQKLKAKAQTLEETRERIERYKWVLQILTGAATKSTSDRTLSKLSFHCSDI